MNQLLKTPVLVMLLGVVLFSDSAAQQQQIPDSALRESWEALLAELVGPEGAPEGRRAISAFLENLIFTPAFDHHKQPPRPERARLRDRIAEIANLEVKEYEEWLRCESETPTNDPDAARCEFLPDYAWVVAISIADEIPGQKQLIFYSVSGSSGPERRIATAFYQATFEKNGGNWTLTGFRFAGIT